MFLKKNLKNKHCTEHKVLPWLEKGLLREGCKKSHTHDFPPFLGPPPGN